jgi:hypothetical protein
VSHPRKACAYAIVGDGGEELGELLAAAKVGGSSRAGIIEFYDRTGFAKADPEVAFRVESGGVRKDLRSGHSAACLARWKRASGRTATQIEERCAIQQSIATVAGGKVIGSEDALRDALIIDKVKQIIYGIKGHGSAQDGKTGEAGCRVNGIWTGRIEIRIHAAEAPGGVAYPEMADWLIRDRAQSCAIKHLSARGSGDGTWCGCAGKLDCAGGWGDS